MRMGEEDFDKVIEVNLKSQILDWHQHLLFQLQDEALHETKVILW